MEVARRDILVFLKNLLIGSCAGTLMLGGTVAPRQISGLTRVMRVESLSTAMAGLGAGTGRQLELPLTCD